MMILDEIIKNKQAELKVLASRERDLIDGVLNLKKKSPFSFRNALSASPLNLIAEIKKASPSKGVIVQNFDPVARAQLYADMGATCLSVLTDQQYFQGHADYIKAIKRHVSLPILRKDFIIDPLQVYESLEMGADAILLIMRILTQDQAQYILTLAHELGLDVLIEVHSQEDLKRAETLEGRDMIGFNNRNLETFEVDLTLSQRLLEHLSKEARDSCLLISESGYSSGQDIKTLAQHGFAGVLIGAGLVTSPSLKDFFDEN